MDSILSIQTVAQHMTRSKPTATWKLRMGAGPYSPQRSPQASSSSVPHSQQGLRNPPTQTPPVISTPTWRTGNKFCSGLQTTTTSGLFTKELRTRHQPLMLSSKNFLTGTNTGLVRNVNGFFRYSPADQNKRVSTSGLATINGLHFFNNHGVSEAHGGTDRWVDMWNGHEITNNYVFSDTALSRGTKCIAGYCYENKPIWVMVR